MTRRFYFGSPRPHLFGALTMPPEGVAVHDAGVVICSPIGHEESSAYRPLRGLAHQLALGGHPTLRFDLPGVGDSLGEDTDEGLLGSWLASIATAVETLRTETGVATVALVGVRLGATLAALAAAREVAVDELVLWEPPVRGKAYVREMRAFNALARREETEPSVPYDPLPEGAVEASGFLIAPTTVDDLSQVDLTTLEFVVAAPRRILLGGKPEPRDGDPLAVQLRSQGVEVDCVELDGLEHVVGAMPHGPLPDGFARIRDWLHRGAPLARRRPASGSDHEPDHHLDLTDGSGAIERVIRIDAVRGTFGLAALPSDAERTGTWAVFVSTGTDRGTGPNRLWVGIARRWAEQGVPTLRVGTGDEEGVNTETLDAMYDDIAIRDTAGVLAHLRAAYGARRFVLLGMCAGAYASLHTALLEPDVVAVALVNPVTLLWNQEAPTELAQYARLSPFRRDRLTKLLSGKMRREHVQRAFTRSRALATTWVLSGARKLVGRDSAADSELTGMFDALLTRGCRLGFVFSRGSDGLDYLRWKLGPSLGGLPEHNGVGFEIVDGPDHTFRALWSHDVLRELLERELEAGGVPLERLELRA